MINQGIGTDPTTIEVIETLDVPSPNNSNNKQKVKPPKKEKSGIFSKILFTILIIGLMGAVAYGIYYYLKIAGNKVNNNTNSTPSFALKDVEVGLGESLSDSLSTYGDFSKMDVSKCQLNLDEVDTSQEGTYDYSVICDGAKYSATITVKKDASNPNNTTINVEPNPNVNLSLTSSFKYVVMGTTLSASELITSNEEYTYEFEDKEDATSQLSNTGLHGISIKAINAEGKYDTIMAFVYVLETAPKMYFTCENPQKTLTDKIVFDNNKNDMNVSVRMNKYTYESDTEYNNMLSHIENGLLTINDDLGYAITDDINKTITLVKKLGRDILNQEYGKEFPTTYNEISNYYRNEIRFTCSL